MIEKPSLIQLYNDIKLIAIERKWCKNNEYVASITRSKEMNCVRFKPTLMSNRFRDNLSFFGYIRTLEWLKEIILFYHPEWHSQGYKICISDKEYSSQEKDKKRFLEL